MLWALTLSTLVALPVVAIDAGHGGSQHGARGTCGLLEKDVTATLATQLFDILHESGLVTPLLLRPEDRTVALPERFAAANAAGAALLVSIHANASPSPAPHGSETFFLSAGAAGGRLARLARRENDGVLPAAAPATDIDLQRLLDGLTLDAAHSESQALALRVQAELDARLPRRGRGVLQAPFLVLLGARMAAVLVEVGFLSNPEECALLQTVAHQQVLAGALATAVLGHLLTLGPTAVAAP